MSMINCPECHQRVSSLAGTCPHCGVAIRGNVKQCPTCKTYVMKDATTCPVCSSILQPAPESADGDTATGGGGKQPVRKNKGKCIAWTLLGLALCIAVAASCYIFTNRREKQREEEQYARLEALANPEYYQQFLIDFPNSSH